MLFEAEQSLQELNKLCLQMAATVSKENLQSERVLELELELKLERQQNLALKADLQAIHLKLTQSTTEKAAMSTRVTRAEEEKEMYITQLIKVKSEQAEMLD